MRRDGFDLVVPGIEFFHHWEVLTDRPFDICYFIVSNVKDQYFIKGVVVKRVVDGFELFVFKDEFSIGRDQVNDVTELAAHIIFSFIIPNSILLHIASTCVGLGVGKELSDCDGFVVAVILGRKELLGDFLQGQGDFNLVERLGKGLR